MRALAGAILLVAGIATASAAGIRLPDGPGANLVYARCQTCHDLQYVVVGKGLLPTQWNAVVASMKDYGMVLNGDEREQIVRYLGTYLGPQPPPAQPAAPAEGQAHAPQGDSVFAQNCSSCHGSEGRGRPGSFPPLAGNPDLGKDGLFPVLVVLHGIAGPIEVAGEKFNASMPSFAHLSDGEIAAVVDFVRTAWGARLEVNPVTSAAVAQARKRDMTPAEVHAYRAAMK